MGTAVRPAKTSPGPWDAFADVDAFVDEVLAELKAMAKGRQPADALGTKAAADRSSAAQGGEGDLVRLLLWHAVAGHRIVVRHPLQHALWTVCSLDPAWPLAPAARPAAPQLAPRLRGCSGAERRGHRQSILPLGAELL
jgi:hypothetical protein